jgi:hypothetical protein
MSVRSSLDLYNWGTIRSYLLMLGQAQPTHYNRCVCSKVLPPQCPGLRDTYAGTDRYEPRLTVYLNRKFA